MVLNDLGRKISSALSKLNEAPVIDQEVLNGLLKEVCNALIHADVDMKLVFNLRKKILAGVDLEDTAAGISRRKKIEDTVIGEIRNLLDPGKVPWRPTKKKGIKSKMDVVMMVGLQGAGKTTTCTKLALYYKERKNLKVGLLCSDTYRAGAHDQLKQNAAKVGVEFYGDRECSDPVQIAMDGLEGFAEDNFDIVIVDTSGRHKQESALFEEMTAIHQAITPDETIFVMDSSIGQAAFDQAKAFHDAVDVGSVILTKLDGHAKGGGALSAVAATGSPITYIGTGEQFDCLEPFEPDSLVRRILGKGDIGGLARRIQEAEIKDNQEELLKKIQQGKLTLRDMMTQFKNVLKLGPVNSIMQMIPGFSNLGKEHGDESQKRIQRFLYVMDSMTDEELDGDLKFLRNQNRRRRICRGSGMPDRVLNELVEMYKPFEAATKKLKNMKMKPGGMPQNASDLAGMFPPHVLKQFGGTAGIRQMMKKFEDGNFDPAKMQEMMKNMGVNPNTGKGGKKSRRR